MRLSLRLNFVKYFIGEFAGRLATARAFHNRTDELAATIRNRYFQTNRRPAFGPPAIVINPGMAIDYWLGWSLVISRT
jgi:hypothetical protein